jgi:putative tryptophan/tyrosine transport system substrate-binding protein
MTHRAEAPGSRSTGRPYLGILQNRRFRATPTRAMLTPVPEGALQLFPHAGHNLLLASVTSVLRRCLRATLAFALLAVPLAGQAQQGRVYRVGVVFQGGSYSDVISGLRDGLKGLGFEEGKQFVLLMRDAKGDLKSVETAARSLESEKVDLIYAIATSVSLVAKRATTRVPIVFYAGTDPVTVGLVRSFRRPGGRLTGINGQLTDLTGKRLELLKEMIPGVRRVVTVYNPDNPAAQQAVKLARAAAHQLKVEILERRVTSVEELRAAVRALRPGDADAYFQMPDAMVTSQTDLILETTNAQRLPAVFQYKDAVTKGGLASYGESYYALGRLSAKHVRSVLLGADPGTIPIEQFDRPEFVINLKTAKALGLTIPQSVLLRADEVIQ